MAKEQQKMEVKKEGENLQRLLVQRQREQHLEKERQDEQKRDLMQAHLVEFFHCLIHICGVTWF